MRLPNILCRLAGAFLCVSMIAAAPLARAEIKVGYSDWPSWVA